MTMLSGFFKIASIDPSYWTLFVEIQFYTFILIILLLKKISNIHILLMFWLLITALLIPFNYGKIHRIFITDYSAYFAAGAGFFLIWKDGISRKNSLIVLAGYVLAIYKHMTQNGNFYPQSQHNLLIASIIITLFFVFFYFISTRLTGKLGQQQWIKLGAITYPLYLIHQIVGFKIFNAFYSTINKHILFWGTIVLMLLVSYLISQHLEKKFASVLKVFLNKVDRSINNTSLFPRKKFK